MRQIWIKVPDPGMVRRLRRRKMGLFEIEVGDVSPVEYRAPGGHISPQLKYARGNKPVDPSELAYVMPDKFRKPSNPSRDIINDRDHIVRHIRKGRLIK